MIVFIYIYIFLEKQECPVYMPWNSLKKKIHALEFIEEKNSKEIRGVFP